MTGSANAEFKDLNFELLQADLSLSSYTINYALENMGIQVRQTEPLRARWDDGDVKIDALAVNVATENFSDGAGTKLVDTIRLWPVNSRVPQLRFTVRRGCVVRRH